MLDLSMFTTDAMIAATDDAATLNAMLAFEAALATAQSETGVIPREVAPIICSHCLATHYDSQALGRAARNTATIAIPLIKALTKRVADQDKSAAGWVHWGATSQDVVDTGLVLQLRQAGGFLLADVQRLGDQLAGLAEAHIKTPVLARTLLQPGPPTTFGLKASGWLGSLSRVRLSLSRALEDMRVLQLGGAVGTLASLGEHAGPVTKRVADMLGLKVPDAPWHSDRTRLVALATAIGMLIQVLGKMGGDFALMMQFELRELSERPVEGRGGSSTMPHKKNPVGPIIARAASEKAPGLIAGLMTASGYEFERGVGGWQNERTLIIQLVQLAAGSLDQMVGTVGRLEINDERMLHNIGETGGVVQAEAIMLDLGAEIGRAKAHEIISALVPGELAEFANRLKNDDRVNKHLDEKRIDALLNPQSYLGQSETFVDALVKTWQDPDNK